MRVPQTACLRMLHEVGIGRFLIDGQSRTGMAVMWSDNEPTAGGCCFVPLTGDKAFEVAWSTGRSAQQVPWVLDVGKFELRAQFDGLVEGTVGFENANTPMAKPGDLVFLDKGMAVVVSNAERDVLVWLESGKMDDRRDRHILIAHSWSLSAIHGAEALFTVERRGEA